MRRFIQICIALLLALSISIVVSLTLAGNSVDGGLIVPGIAATIFLPLSLILICIEEIIFGKKRTKIIAATSLFLILTLLGLWWISESKSASIQYCNGKPVSQWTTALPSECGGSSTDTASPSLSSGSNHPSILIQNP